MPTANSFVRLRWSRRCLAALSLTLALPAAYSQGGPCRVLTPSLQASYAGGCQNGLAHGQGQAQGADRYQGAFHEGQPQGQGVYQFADGRRFEGEFLAGRVNGRAKFTYASGDVLEGEFRDNRLTGYGRMQRAGQSAWAMVQLSAEGRLQLLEGSPSGVADAAAAAPVQAQWQAQLDFQDLFPAYLFATATRKQPEANSASRGLESLQSRGAFIAPLQLEVKAQSRYIGANKGVQYLGDAWGLVGVRYRATQPNERIRLVVQADDIADPAEASFQLGAPGEYALYPKLRYRFERLRTVEQPRPVHVRWQLFVNDQFAGQQERTTQLRALQDAPLMLFGERTPEVMGWVLTAFVTEEAPWIDPFLKEAFAKSRAGPFGYQGKAEDVLEQVGLVYDALKARGIKYSSITATAGKSEQLFSQTVRLPSQSIRMAQANCVDGSVLLASVLRRMGIETYIILGPGHAMMGFLVAREAKESNLVVVETTLLGTDSFSNAVKAGMATFAKWKKEVPSSDPRFQVIGVSDARKAGVMPIPL